MTLLLGHCLKVMYKFLYKKEIDTFFGETLTPSDLELESSNTYLTHIFKLKWFLLLLFMTSTFTTRVMITRSLILSD